MAATVEIDLRAFNRLIQAGPKVVHSVAKFELGDLVSTFEKETKQQKMNDSWLNPARSGLASRSTDLIRSFKTQVTGDDIDSLVAEAFAGKSGPASAYARMQLDGKPHTIRASSHKLTIPVESPRGSGKFPALTAAGRARFPNARAANLELLFRRTKTGRMLVFLGKPGKTPDKDKMFYILKDEVKIPSRVNFYEEWRRYWGRNGTAALARIVSRVSEKLNKGKR